MKAKYSWLALFSLMIIFGCDDNTGSLGVGTLPDDDQIPVEVKTYSFMTQSLLSDSVYARTSTAYLGKYTDPNFGVFEADFLAQFQCPDNFTLVRPDSLFVPGSIRAQLSFVYDRKGFFGDSLSANRMSIYELNKGVFLDSKPYYYTDIDPQQYYNPQTGLLAKKAYSAKNMAISDSLWNTGHYSFIGVQLPSEVGTTIVNYTKTNPEYFKNSDEFIRNVFGGIYVQCDHGDGTILYIDDIYLNIRADVYATDSITGAFPIKKKASGHETEDSIYYQYPVAEFKVTKEVIQANHFQNSDKLKELVADNKCTYLKTPAGIFTEATLPIGDIINSDNKNDTINGVSLSFINYNKVGSTDALYEMPAPQRLLMVRKKDMYSFFEKNSLIDNTTSYLTTHNDAKNKYEFKNINRLVTACINERRAGEAQDPDWLKKNPEWNKIVLIPVSVTLDSDNTTITTIRHDLRLTSAKLEGGLAGKSIEMEVVYTGKRK